MHALILEDEQRVVRERAYLLYLARGRQEGHALEDWLTAEAALRAARAETVHGGKRSKVDVAGDESFPASDPPSWTPTHAGAPQTRMRRAERDR